MILLAGVLDDDPGVRPFRHVFVGQAPAWRPVPEDELPRFDLRPPPEGRLPRKR